MTRALLALGVVMIAVGTVYGGRGANGGAAAVTGQAVDLPAALAVRPHTYPDGSLSPDYKDAAIAALQVAYDQMAQALTEAQQHDADAHSGCVPWRSLK